ncbi:ParB/Srx family N-terminal domain-containing protein [Nonomuraea ferruginea]
MDRETITMMTEGNSMHLGGGTLFDALNEELAELTADYGDEVNQALKLAAAQPLSTADADRLFTEILVVLRTGGRNPDPATRERVVRDIQRRVSELVATPRIPAGPSDGGIRLVSKHGLDPREVLPTPQFHNHAIPMTEGYVDVNELILWKDNHRVELQVEEFKERNHRLPDDDEMLMLVQGQLDLPSMGKEDPFEIEALARSIARKGVERPPIVTHEGEPKDGNRRIAAAKYVLSAKGFTAEERDRARWIRVLAGPKGDNRGPVRSDRRCLELRAGVQAGMGGVRQGTAGGRGVSTRSQRRPRSIHDQSGQPDQAGGCWAVRDPDARGQPLLEDDAVERGFPGLSRGEGTRTGRDEVPRQRHLPVVLRDRRWQEGAKKLTERLDQDDDLKGVVYDLMYDVLDSGAQVRKLHQVVADENALKVLMEAHALAATDQPRALSMVNEAIGLASRNSPTKKIGFEQWLHTAVARFGSASPDDWARIDQSMLMNLDRVLTGALGAVDGALRSQGIAPVERP